MVLDALASYLGDLLRQVAEEELRMLLGVTGEIDKLRNKLLDLKNFLADADRRNITDESVQEWVGQLKRAMYEATDILDLCRLKNPFHAREMGTRIKALNHKLDIIKERATAFNFINLGSYDDRHSTRVRATHHHNRETSAELDRRSGVVGDKIEEDKRALVARIMQQTRTREEANGIIMVVAIVGVGGIGKTTLAREVFNDEAIQGGFSKRIWLSVNQNFSDAELLRRAIVEAAGGHQKDMVGDSMVSLHRTLREALVGNKTFLVMDDVWDHGAWEGVMKIPFVNAAASGSRVLITTRDEGVARAMAATWPYHHVDTLAPDDAWSLLKKQVLSSEIDEDHINTLKYTGLKIIQKCGGLPLAIKIMGGLLRGRGELRRDWEQVLNDSKWSINKMPQELNNAVFLSYEDMPPYLKQCFLYYSLLPKNKDFNVDEVVAMWISEGIVHGYSSDLEELGEKYYKELISRNLIEPDKWTITQGICRMHDVVRSFAQYMTKDEALVAHDGDIGILTKLHPQKFLRLSIETHGLQSGEVEWKSLHEQQLVRTLILTIQIKVKPSDSLVTFSSLRTLHIESVGVAALVESLHRLKLLRYLTLVDISISVLPVSIGKMKLLQHLDLSGCKNLANLPSSIVKLGQLRLLHLANISMIPRGFCSLTNLRKLMGFRAHMDGDWCSLEELGPLSQLKLLELNHLENVSVAPSAANARLGEKKQLTELSLDCTTIPGEDRLVKEKEGVPEEDKQRIEMVFDQLCPPPSVENIYIKGYFGQQLPSWMISTSIAPLNNLKYLFFSDLACCTQLPNGLCQLPYLQFFQVKHAPCIKRVGTQFLQAATTPFPRLNNMVFIGMVEWEEWEWEEQVQAMPRLEKLLISNCKLRCAPPGLASNSKALSILRLSDVQHLSYLENFPSIVELVLSTIPDLERITNFPNLQKLTIDSCPKLKLLESIPALDKFVLEDYTMEELPEYMRGITPRHLQLGCRLWLLASLAAGQFSLEWDKFNHVEHVKAYAPDGNNPRKWYVLYRRRDNFKLDSNIRSSSVFQETLSSCMVDARGFESMYKMGRSTFSYVCNLVRVQFLEQMMARDHTFTFVDGRVMSIQDAVAVALRVLSSGEPPEIVGSSVGVSESTVSLVTLGLLQAWDEQKCNEHARWPYSSNEKEKIKRKFAKIHGLPNCCGVVHTTQFKFGSNSHDHVDNDGFLSQIIVDPDMRFTDICSRPSGSLNQCSILQDSLLFEQCEKGVILNGGKLKASSVGGLDIGEYIIGDSGYPLRPWLLTPYQLEGDLSLSDSDYKKEFNKRHSEATDIVMLRALARLKDTWKCLQGEGWKPNNQHELALTIQTCYLLHNIVIDMEEGAGMPRNQEQDTIKQVRQLADEDPVRVRDALSRHLIESGVRTTAAEEELLEEVAVASGSGDENKEGDFLGDKSQLICRWKGNWPA